MCGYRCACIYSEMGSHDGRTTVLNREKWDFDVDGDSMLLCFLQLITLLFMTDLVGVGATFCR